MPRVSRSTFYVSLPDTAQPAALPTAKSINERTFSARHPDHGELSVTRRPRLDPADRLGGRTDDVPHPDRVYFDVQLTSDSKGPDPEKPTVMEATIECQIVDPDPANCVFPGASSFGYSIVHLNTAVNDINLYAPLNVFIASTGQQLGIENFLASGFIGEGTIPEMRGCCEALGMEPPSSPRIAIVRDEQGRYAGSVYTTSMGNLKTNAIRMAETAGWKIPYASHQSDVA